MRKVLSELEQRLQGSQYLGGSTPTRLDIALAAVSYPWALSAPNASALKQKFAAGQDRGTVTDAPDHIVMSELGMQLAKEHPQVHELCVRMYRDHRVFALAH